MNWKPFLHQAFVPPVYTSMEVSADERFFIGKYRTATKINLIAGYVERPNENLLDIQCGPILSNYEELAAKIKTILSVIPIEKDAFLFIPRRASVSPWTMDSKFTKKINALMEESSLIKKQKSKQEQPSPFISNNRKNGRRQQASPFANDHPPANEDIPIPQEPGPNITNGVHVSETTAEELPVKILPMTQDEFLSMLAGIEVREKKARLDYDLRMTINKPKVGAKVNTLQFRLDLGKYFLENKPDFKEVLAGKGMINGKEEELLMFDNMYFKDKNMLISMKKEGKFEKTSTSAGLIQMVVEDLKIPISQISGNITIIKFDVIPVTVKDLPDSTFVLTNMRREVTDSTTSNNNQ